VTSMVKLATAGPFDREPSRHRGSQYVGATREHDD
jgi:hypothetical protein